jgi:hypothetical protein
MPILIPQKNKDGEIKVYFNSWLWLEIIALTQKCELLRKIFPVNQATLVLFNIYICNWIKMKLFYFLNPIHFSNGSYLFE